MPRMLFGTHAPENQWQFTQSKTLLTIDERGSKIARNDAFDENWRQMAIETASNDFVLRSSIVFTFLIAAYPVWFTCDQIWYKVTIWYTFQLL